MGGLFCELIGGLFNWKGKNSWKALALIMVTIFMPLIFLALCSTLIFAGFVYLIAETRYGKKIAEAF